MDNYSKEAYKRPLMVHADIAMNPEISDAECMIWAMMLEYPDMTNKQLSEARGLSIGYINKLRKKMYDRGIFDAEKDASGKITKYIPVSPQQAVLKKIEKFITEFSVFFKGSLPNWFIKFQNQDAEKLYFIMSGIEHQYKKSKTDIKSSSWGLLKSCYEGQFRPSPSYEKAGPDWWLKEIEKKQRTKKRAKKETVEKKTAKDEQAQQDEFIKSLTKRQYKNLEASAIEKMKSNGGLPKFNKKKMIEFEMYELGKEQRE